jgi:hypothetical protein
MREAKTKMVRTGWNICHADSRANVGMKQGRKFLKRVR